MAAYAEAMTRAQPAMSAGGDDRSARHGDQRARNRRSRSIPRVRAPPRWRISSANLRYQAPAIAQARGAFELAVAQGAPRTLRTLSLGGVAYTWEAERNYAKAIEAFKIALEGLGPKDFYYEELLLGLGRTQELAGRRPRRSRPTAGRSAS